MKLKVTFGENLLLLEVQLLPDLIEGLLDLSFGLVILFVQNSKVFINFVFFDCQGLYAALDFIDSRL